MFYPSEITLAAIPTVAWLLPIAIIVPVDVIVIGTLLLLATRARRSVIESSFLSSGLYGERRSRKYGFYVNPGDSRLWVPRPGQPRSKTINLGHPNGIRAFAAFILALTLLPTVILAVVFLILSLTLPQ
jgi:uncharacterized membrane protein